MRFLNDPIVASKLAGAKKLSKVDVDDYDAIFYVGGLGPTMDLPKSEANTRVATKVCKLFFELFIYFIVKAHSG